MSGGGGGGDDFQIEEEHENHERYLITYADMITLLMALFVILYAMGGPPQEDDYAQFAQGASNELIQPLEGGLGIWQGGGEAAPEAVAYEEQADDPREVDAANATELARQLEGSATDGTGSGTGDGYGIDSTVDERGVVLTLPADALLFDAGSADIGDRGVEILQQVAEVLKGTTNELLIEGHTDSRPLVGDSNWDLSSQRAASVAEVLIAAGIDPERLVVEGFADTRPVADNDTEEGRRKNRRVELVVKVEFSGATPEPITVDPSVEPAASSDDGSAEEPTASATPKIMPIGSPLTAGGAGSGGGSSSGSSSGGGGH